MQMVDLVEWCFNGPAYDPIANGESMDEIGPGTKSAMTACWI